MAKVKTNDKSVGMSVQDWVIKDLNRHFTKENVQMKYKYLKGNQCYYPLGKWKLKTQWYTTQLSECLK